MNITKFKHIWEKINSKELLEFKINHSIFHISNKKRKSKIKRVIRFSNIYSMELEHMIQNKFIEEYNKDLI